MKNIREQKLIKSRLQEVESYLESFLTFDPEFISERAQFNLNAGGKRLRPAFVILTAAFYDKFDKDVIRTAALMELVHMTSLIHDDINDDSDLRRGQTTINAEYSNDVAVNIGDYIMIKALLHVYEVSQYKRILELIGETTAEMSKGEVAQLRSMYDIEQDMVDYYYRIERKTALLISLSCQLGAILAGASKEEQNIFYDYGYHLGMAFQMKDDLFDLLDTDKQVGKPTGQDLESGLLNLPTILLLEKDFPEKEDIQHRIANRFPNGQEDVDFVVQLIHREGCIQESEDIILNHISKAKSVLNGLPDKPILEIMRHGADYVYERSY